MLQDLVATERGGARSAELFRRNAFIGRLAVLTAVVWPIAVVTAFEWSWLRTSAGTFMANVAAGLFSAAVIAVIERLWRRMGGLG